MSPSSGQSIKSAGGDLVLLRHGHGWRTSVVIHTDAFPTPFPQGARLRVHVFDQNGRELGVTVFPLLGRFVAFTSDDLARKCGIDLSLPDDRVLFVELEVPADAEGTGWEAIRRLFSVVDWFDDTGDVATLHNDQSIDPELAHYDGSIEFTEIIAHISSGERVELLFIAGGDTGTDCQIRVDMRNSRGDTRSPGVPMRAEPFSVQSICLHELLPDIAEFAAGQPLAISGVCPAAGRFLRPYVIHRGARFCAYHGGNRYAMKPMPTILYGFLGNGEVNPVAVFDDDRIETWANVLNSHGSLEQDFWVGVRLYDAAGTLIAENERWLLAVRHGYSRGRLADLLPPGTQRPFVGHAAYFYSPVPGAGAYPQRVQVLSEYRGADYASHVMLWSDQWNAPDRQRLLARYAFTGWFRVWCDDQLVTSIILGNVSVAEDYSRSANAEIRLINQSGEVLTCERMVPPSGTLTESIDCLFPEAAAHLTPTGLGIVEVSSAADVSKMQVTRHQRSGVMAFEHFMSLPIRDGDRVIRPCGS